MSSPSERSARGEAQKRKSESILTYDPSGTRRCPEGLGLLHTDDSHLLGSRSVSNLTPSQLERKRANDREAQRNIRLRTKETIERLTRENRELYSQKQALQNELDSLRGHTRPQAPGGQYSAAGRSSWPASVIRPR